MFILCYITSTGTSGRMGNTVYADIPLHKKFRKGFNFNTMIVIHDIYIIVYHCISIYIYIYIADIFLI